MIPHTIMQLGKYTAGKPILFKNKFEGTAIVSLIPVINWIRAVAYSA